MIFDLPRNVILPVDIIDVRLDNSQHPFERDNAQEIAANWQCEVAQNPALFDGTVVLLSQLTFSEGRLSGLCHPVRYATFLYWRNNRGFTGTEHAFAHAMLVSSDGALIAIRMAPHTVNAGCVYFAAGSFEPCDFRDGLVDVEFNMKREVQEETGLDLDQATRDSRYYVLAGETGTVIFRRYVMKQTADEIARLIEAHVAGETTPEIEGPVTIRNALDIPVGLMPHMRPLVDWHFGGAGKQALV